MSKHPYRGVIATVAAIGLFLVIGGVARWQPVDRAFALESAPSGLHFVVIGAWLLVAALTTIPKPYNGLLLMVASVLVAPYMHYYVEEGAKNSSFMQVAAALAVFPAAGALLMLVAHISTEKQNRRPWLAEAWPGIVLVVAGLAVVGVVATRTVPRVHYVPGMMLPAERGP